MWCGAGVRGYACGANTGVRVHGFVYVEPRVNHLHIELFCDVNLTFCSSLLLLSKMLGMPGREYFKIIHSNGFLVIIDILPDS